MNDRTKRIVFILLAGIFAVSAGLSLRQVMHYRAADDAYAAAVETAGASAPVEDLADEPVPEAEFPPAKAETPDEAMPAQELAAKADPFAGQAPLEEEAEFLATLDIGSLKETNSDVLGWIFIPGTEISYPLLQGEDNLHYLSTAWDGSYNYAGSIFLECTSNPDLNDFNTIIYGHNMRNGSMFADITSYYMQDFYESHPYVYLTNGSAVYRYEVFAAYEAELGSETYRVALRQEQTRINFLRHSAESTAISCSASPDTDDRVLTLSTCTGSGHDTRWVVQAVLTGYFEN